MSVTCLVADDSLFARMLVKDAVGKIFNDVQFAEASSGKEAFSKYVELKGEIDWYLLDINMGEPNGVLTAQNLIEQGISNKQIALITGNKSQDLQQQAESMGLRYIHKAIGPKDVEEFINRLKDFFESRG